MKTLIVGLRNLLVGSLLALLPGLAVAEDSNQTFKQSELDQMLAPIALYPDSLLSQILMATTYPADVAEAVKWSRDNPDQKGDNAVIAVQEKTWDPSVMSLVAFPQVLDMMGKQPEWVQNLGDAFLASPDGVMDTVQTLRKKAKEEGSLETTEEQTVAVDETSNESVIVIQPTDPKVVYVPVYNPTVVYGSWWWPSYRPYYYYPAGYGFGGAVVRGIGFGIGIGITNALWGGCNWRNHSVDININRYNNVNVNRNRLDVSNRKKNWQHNANNRKGVPYRDKGSRDTFSKSIGGADKRTDFRGRDAERARAQSALKDRGVDPAKGRKQLSGASGDRARHSVNKANRENAGQKLTNRGEKGIGGAAGNKSGGRERATVNAAKRTGDRSTGKAGNRGHSGSHALKNVGNAGQSRRNHNRGTVSRGAHRSAGGRAGGGRRGR